MDYLLAHDLGTSGDKAVLFTLQGEILAEHTVNYDTRYPFDKAAEQDAGGWWRAFCVATKALIEQQGLSPGGIAAVSFSAQMNACLPVDAAGQPLRPAMIWADQRGGAQADRLTDAFGLKALYELTGHRVSASHAIAKMAWYREHEPENYRRTAKFLQAKDYVAFCLTGHMQSDYSDASHLGALDQRTLRWSQDILAEAGIGIDKMPRLLPSTAEAGRVTKEAAGQCGLMAGTPVILGGGDGPCATAGAGVYRPGQAYLSLGTSAWIGALSPEPVMDEAMRCFSLMHLDGRQYLSLGAMQSAGHALLWAMDTLLAPENNGDAFAQLERMAGDIPPGSGGLFFLPYLMGERSPWWNPNASGCFIGLTARHGREEMLRAVMEGVGYNLGIILDVLARPKAFEGLRIVGGGARNACWLQILSDIWQQRLMVTSSLSHASCAGAALCAGIGVGAVKDFSAAAAVNPVAREIYPNPDNKAVYGAAAKKFTALYMALEHAAFSG